MILKSVNSADVQEISWRGKLVKTGIFKKPISGEVQIDVAGIVGDNVVDKRYHGDYDKGIYAYGMGQYDFWKEQYANLDFEWGMFGENLTIDGLDESTINIGDRWMIGEDVVLEVSQPRQPCFKLGARFNTQKVVKSFAQSPYPGVYFRILETGNIKAGQKITVEPELKNPTTILEVWKLMFAKDVDLGAIRTVLEHPLLSESTKETLRKRL